MKKSKKRLKRRKIQNKWNELGSYLHEKCPKCGQKILLMYQYDARCCTVCNEWLDAICNDSDCLFCAQRPQTPYEVYYITDIVFDKKRWRQEKYGHKINGIKRHKRKEKLRINILEEKLVLL